MRYVGDFFVSSIIRLAFNTSQADGTPITLAGTPVVSVYKDGSTTESTAGVTLTVDFDARTGMHLVVIDTSADGTFYSSGSDFRVVITTGTVNAISVVGTVIGAFSLANRSALRPTTTGQTLNITSGKAAATLASGDVTGSLPTADSSGTTTLLSRLTAPRATALDNLDAAVSTRLASASYATPPAANVIAAAVWADAIGVAVKASTDKIPASPAAVGSVMQIDLSQSVPSVDVTSLTSMTVGHCFAAARADAAGAESVVSTTYTRKNPDGTTFRSFTLNSATDPTTRT